jgi:hypothetical protein
MKAGVHSPGSTSLDHVIPSTGTDGPTAVIHLDDRVIAKDTTP